MNISFVVLRSWLRLHPGTRRPDRGASLVEYALLIALIALACVAAVAVLGNATKSGYNSFTSSY